ANGRFDLDSDANEVLRRQNAAAGGGAPAPKAQSATHGSRSILAGADAATRRPWEFASGPLLRAPKWGRGWLRQYLTRPWTREQRQPFHNLSNTQYPGLIMGESLNDTSFFSRGTQ